ncbi:CHAT domain-containing protein [Streptomyces anulatus]
MREELMSRLFDRVRRFTEGDPGPLLEAEATREASSLWWRREVDAAALRCLSWFHWCRYLALPSDLSALDSQIVLEHSLVLHYIDPGLVIKPLQGTMDQFLPPPEQQPSALLERAQELLQQVGTDGDYRLAGPFCDALDLMHRALNGTGDNSTFRAAVLANIRGAMQAHHVLLRQPAHLEAAVATAQAAVDALPAGHPDRAVHLTNVCATHMIRHDRWGDLTDLDQAVLAGEASVEANAPDPAVRHACLTNLDSALTERYRLTSDPNDVNRMIRGLKSLAATAGGSERLEILTRLARVHRMRYERNADPADLDAAVGLGQETARSKPPPPPKVLRGALTELATALHLRYQSTHQPPDLDAAIEAGREAVSRTPEAEGQSWELSNLGTALQSRYALCGRREDIDEAVRWNTAAVALLATGDTNRAATLTMLGTALLAQSEHTGNPETLDTAIRRCREAAAVSTEGIERALVLSNLGVAHRERYHLLGHAEDLNAAIAALEESLTASADNTSHPERKQIQSMLGITLKLRYIESSDPADLDRAVEHLRYGAEGTPAGHPDLAGRLYAYGRGLLARHMVAKDRADLDTAVRVCEKAVGLLPAEHRHLGSFLGGHGLALRTRYEVVGEQADLDDAIIVLDRSQRATPKNHPGRAGALTTFASACFARYKKHAQSDDLRHATQAWEEATDAATSPAHERMIAAHQWGTALADTGTDWAQAARALGKAVALLPLAAWHGLEQSRQQGLLTKWSRLTGEAAACAINAGNVPQALEFLEQGRSIMWGHALNRRADLTALRERYPKKAQRLDELRAELDRGTSDTFAVILLPRTDAATESAGFHGWAWERRVQAARKWDALLHEVRRLPGFETFLLPPTSADLLPGGEHGPVVLINVSRYRCDAVAVTPDGIRHVPLPALDADKAVQQTVRYLNAMWQLVQAKLPEQGDRKGLVHTVRVVLAELWETVTRPVLASLDLLRTAQDEWPRIWWCPTGPLALLPLHATGQHSAPNGSSIDTEPTAVLDAVVSSYTPNLRTLIAGRRPSAVDTEHRLLVVALPEPPAYASRLGSLPGARTEVALLTARLPDRSTPLINEQATHAEVAERLADHAFIHFACHGAQDLFDPFKNRLLLYDAPLSVSDLARHTAPRAELAFLSACQTAIGGANQPDEAIHLAAGLQFIGYRHVIATLWSIADRPAPEVADQIWKTLTPGGEFQPDLAAVAVHQAVRALRRRRPAAPHVWAPYIHLGP